MSGPRMEAAGKKSAADLVGSAAGGSDSYCKSRADHNRAREGQGAP